MLHLIFSKFAIAPTVIKSTVFISFTSFYLTLISLKIIELSSIK